MTENVTPEEPKIDQEKLRQDYKDLYKLGSSNEDIAKTLGFETVEALQEALNLEEEEETKPQSVEVELPVYMRKGQHPLEMGNAIVTTTFGVGTTIVINLTSDEGKEMGNLLSSPLVAGISIGGIMSRETINKLS